MAVNYFAYDVTLNPEVIRKILGKWSVPRRARLEGYKLVFDTYSAAWRGGIAGIEEKDNSYVIGALYTIEGEDFPVLDRYQGTPSIRSRIKIRVKTDTGVEEAYTYISTSPRKHVAPSRPYLALMLRGLKTLGYSDPEIVMVERAASQ
ncbi:MAG: gamma-glutamylcyclotransferase family protein [Nitrososphaerota archaeon]|nr:gamma-glutamylcyclotransferase [Candidatus Calditenuaceae archaeon]MDW8073899.1 gamma-glutamylcyclotransferase family protein [Nitrososphaerota archaeon]